MCSKKKKHNFLNFYLAVKVNITTLISIQKKVFLPANKMQYVFQKLPHKAKKMNKKIK